jgi:predicted nucleotidyltransferase
MQELSADDVRWKQRFANYQRALARLQSAVELRQTRALELLRGVFSSYPAVDKAIVYGSRAKGNCRPGSDIDITLEGSALTFDDLLRIEAALDDLMLPWTMDLSLLSHIDNPTLLGHIARVGKPLWVRGRF